MVAELTKNDSKIYSNDDIFSYINSCDLMSVNDFKYTKSIYFKDSDDNISCIIFSLNDRVATILATIDNQKINTTITAQEFYNIFNKHKIFIVK